MRGQTWDIVAIGEVHRVICNYPVIAIACYLLPTLLFYYLVSLRAQLVSSQSGENISVACFLKLIDNSKALVSNQLSINK